MTDLTKAAREALEACETALRQFTKTPSTLADSTARGNAHAALATLSAALSEAPGEEREAFEAWWAGLCPAPYYPGIEKEIARNAWQARAMLAARHSAPTVALTEGKRTLAQKVLDRLVLCYRIRPVSVADACDISIDHSGALLGWIRDAARQSKEGGA